MNNPIDPASPTTPLVDALDPDLRKAIIRIARVPVLLVACDYDGTLAPIVDDPTKAAPLREAVAAVRALALLPQTAVAVISGRALHDLATLSRLPDEVRLVGSHGSEFDTGFVDALDPQDQQLRTELADTLSALVRRRQGIRLEFKPASVAVHLRGAEPEVKQVVLDALRTGPQTWPGVVVTHGKEVVELSVIATHKGMALDALRAEVSASAVVFLGDDVTDENGFAHLHGPDVGIKIGPGETRARYRVDGPYDAARVLALLWERRKQWLYGERSIPIERHSMIANGRTVALVTPDARITWLCHPRPDSAALFADLLGDSAAGYFAIRPDHDGLPLGQRYRPNSMTVETRWSGLTVTDFLDEHPTGGAVPAFGATVAGPDPQGSALVRVLTGSGTVRVEFAPRPGFGQLPIRLQPLGDGLLVLGSNEPVALYSPGIEWNIVEHASGQTALATVDLTGMGGIAAFELRLGTDGLDAHPLSVTKRQEETERRWQEWAETLELPTVARREVLRSALTLRGLWNAPSGAIIAAATTSLPETIGGVRNWDYRYCWLRDSAMAARALVDLGSLEEAESLLAWMGRVVEATGGHPERLSPLYAVDGSEPSAEAVIDTLPGYAGSRPVRVGNLAKTQLQLDVFGAVADLIAEVAKRRGLRPDEATLMEAMVSAVERRWHEPDYGVWEFRRQPEHHVYSKVMCWVTVDRAVQAWAAGGRPQRPDWLALRTTIANNVLTHGWNESIGAYTMAYGTRQLDAASLWIGLSGLLPDDDPKFLATVLKVEAELRSGPAVYRYRVSEEWDDGLPGEEGGFHICTAWMIEAYLRTGRRADAEELFAQMLDCSGPTGLLPEQYDPEAERGLGNHPQAYSHLGLIRCAILLDRSAGDNGRG
jgi:trehalose-phosphatase